MEAPRMKKPRMKKSRLKKLACLMLVSLSSGFGSCAAPAREASAAAAIRQPSPSACVNLNTAEARELESLPGIGPALAGKIIEHRRLYGPFKKPEEVIIIDGFSERRYRQIAGLVCAN